MTSNILKLIACIAMVCDHVGILLLPKLTFLRYIGRIAMPIFAYFIAQGCLYTRSKSKYFLQIFALAVLCQLFYLGEGLLGGGIHSIYLNILFTFSLSILVCSAYLRLKATVESKEKRRLLPDGLLLAAALGIALFCCSGLSQTVGIPVTVDYGLIGVLLPLLALLFKDKRLNFLCFCGGIVVYCLSKMAALPYVWFALLAIPLLAAYNGKRGSKKLKWVFYFFYPVHFAVLYGIALLLT